MLSLKSLKLPNHIAIIPDGNRRWAKRHHLKPWQGYDYGILAFEKIYKKSLKLKIPYLTFWIASLDNLTKRPKEEVKFLCQVFAKNFPKLAKEKIIHQYQVRIQVFGRWERMMPKKVVKAVKKPIEATKKYSRFFLTFLMAYNGDDEMMEAIKKIKKTKIKKITKETLNKYLWTGDLPPVDLLIRTGGEEHLSAGFMMWKLQYAQMNFPKVFFPDFNEREFLKVLKIYSQRERRFGK